tara:strand:- start:74 stop:214 length:141 start_codon:yes stop_codon:yes gene_type:complete
VSVNLSHSVELSQVVVPCVKQFQQEFGPIPGLITLLVIVDIEVADE